MSRGIERLFSTVGYGVPICYRGDGTILIGTRKFTPQELVQYKKNMYGKSYFVRQRKRAAKKMGHERCSQAAQKAVQTKRETWDNNRHELWKSRWWSSTKASPKYRQWVDSHVKAMHTPEAIAKCKQTWKNKDEKITENHHWVNRYFICDCEIDSQEFHEGEWIADSDALYEKANTMMLVYPLSQLPEDTRKTAIRLRTKMYNCKWRVKYWFACRPNVIFEIFQTCNVI